MTGHWMETAERVRWDERTQWIVGEDERGELWVPYRAADVVSHIEYRWGLFNRWNLLDWLRFWNSRRRNEVVWLELNYWRD